MGFARAIWALLVGIKDALVMLLLLLFFGLLYAGLENRAEPIGEGVLALDLDGVVVEQPAKAELSELFASSDRTREFALRELVASLDAAHSDDRVKAVALDLDGFLGGGQAAMADLADAVRRVRGAGKPVVAYATIYSDDSYQVAAAASELWLNPLGAVALRGPGGSSLYFKGLLDKLGVNAHIYRVGTYKAAVEPLTRNDMSPEARANAQALADALLESWAQSVAAARPTAQFMRYMRDTIGAIGAAKGDLAQAALNAKLVDRLGDRRAFEARLAQIGGQDPEERGAFARIKLADYAADVADKAAVGPIGVVTVAGNIIDGQASAGTAGGDSIATLIEAGLRDKSLKALVVRVDSPGGSVLASERIRQAILAAKGRKLPVVVSMGSVAASGGYWIATPADYVFAEPSTITGSIGVFGILPSFEGSLAKLGIGADGVKTTPLSGEPDLLRGPSPEVDALLQASVESTYRRFIGLVAAARRKPAAEIDRIAQGRVWDGGTARQLGLVDGFGGLAEAIDKAGALAGIDAADRHPRFLERPPSFKESLLAALAGDSDEGAANDAFAALGASGEAELAAALGQLRLLLESPRIQLLCLECGPTAAPQAAPPRGLWAELLERLTG